MSFIKRVVPILSSLTDYNRKKFGADLIAGLTVATLLVPQGMAYALLAGVPPIYGLYASIFPLIIYAIFGTSRHLSIGPVAISSLLVLSGVSLIAEPGTATYISLVITAGFFIGLAQMILSFLRLGFLVNFISYPVIAGFTSAAAIIILASQLKDALGITMPRFSNVSENFSYCLSHLSEINWITVVMCLVAIFLMIILRKIHKAIPGPLIIVVLGILATYFFKLDQYGVAIIGDIPKGLPGFVVPEFDLEVFRSLVPVLLTVTTMGVVECISIAKVYEAKHNDYTINPNQELFAIGISKSISAFFQTIPTSGSFTRSAINSDSGAKTNVASLITALVVGLVLIALTPLIFYLPKAILAAIILLAVVKLFDLKEAVYLWKTHRKDFVMMLVTFIATLVMGIELGVLFGVILSIMMVLYKSSKPHIAVLGNIVDTNYYRNINRFPEAKEFDQTLIIRFDDQLYFANSVYFRDRIKALIVLPKYRDLKYIILDASNVHDIDSTALHMLRDLDEDLKKKNIEMHISGAKGPIRDALYKNKLMNDPLKHHVNVNAAIEQLHGGKEGERSISVQTNLLS